MSISSAIQNAQQKVANAYTAVSNKGGTLPATQNLSNLPTAIGTITTSGTVETLNVTPTTSAQQFIPTGGVDGYNPVNVSAVTSSIDNNIKASNIKSGVTILGVSGTVTELNGETKSVSLTDKSGQTFTPTSPKNAITSITVTPNNQARTVTPTTSQQSLTVNTGYSGNGTITVNAVTSDIDSDIKATNIKSGVNILGVNGSVVELNGSSRSVSLTSSSGQTFNPESGKNAITSITVTPNNQARTVTPTTSQQSLSVNSGYSGNGTITVNAVTSAIDSNIQAGNIKSGVTILGTTGTLSSSDFVVDTTNYSGTMNFIVTTDGSMENIKNGVNVVGSADTSISFTMRNAYNGNTTAKFVSLANLHTIDNTNLVAAFRGSKITNADFSGLTTITNQYALNTTFYLSSLQKINLSSLNSINAAMVLSTAFGESKLTSLSFPALNSNSFGSFTDQFFNMLDSVKNCTVHFPSNLQSVIGSWSDVTAGFGGTSTTVLFDLPATT